MIPRNEIILMIEEKDTAVETAQIEIDDLSEQYAYLTGKTIVDFAVADQLKAAVMSGVNVQTSTTKDMTLTYDVARNKKYTNEQEVLKELKYWIWRQAKAFTLNRIWGLCLNGREQSILLQRYKEGKPKKDIMWRDYPVSKWAIEQASTKGIEALQKRMEREGFVE